MASIVGVYGMGHAPNLVTTFDQAGEDVCRRLLGACAEVTTRIKASGATTIVTISNDHFNAFTLANLPAFCVGVGDEWMGPEDDLRQPQVAVKGNPRLGRHILQQLIEVEDFDPAMTYHHRLDHGTYVPVRFLVPDFTLPLVPIFLNTLQPPMPTLRRSAAFGEALRRTIRSFPEEERVAIVGCGGISHFIGVPNQGYINEAFDHRFLDLLQAGDLPSLTGLSHAEMMSAGNGGDEIRSWIAAMAAAEGSRAELLFYAPVPAWLIGVAIADFHYSAD